MTYSAEIIPIAQRRRSMTDPVLTDLAAGTAGEHLVCADLLLQGYRAFLADQNCSYDIAVDIDGRLVRIQVKTTRRVNSQSERASNNPSYIWHVRRAGKGGRRLYAVGEFDLLALVALDIRRIAYMTPSKMNGAIFIQTNEGSKTSGKKARYFSEFPFHAALADIGLRPFELQAVS
jgi:hypothetical protein